MSNQFIHVELNSTNVPEAKAFYKKLFKWKLKDMPMPFPPNKYTTIDVGEGTGGGMIKQMMPATGSAWMPYILVDDLAASTRKAEKLGGEVCKGITRIPKMGAFSIISDPSGAVFGLWEIAPEMKSQGRKPSRKRK